MSYLNVQRHFIEGTANHIATLGAQCNSVKMFIFKNI